MVVTHFYHLQRRQARQRRRRLNRGAFMTTTRTADGPIAASPAISAPVLRRSAGLGAGLSRRSAGVAIGLVSAMCFGTSGTFGSALIAAGWSPAGAVLGRVGIAAL